jgi:hypothetical protein
VLRRARTSRRDRPPALKRIGDSAPQPACAHSPCPDILLSGIAFDGADLDDDLAFAQMCLVRPSRLALVRWRNDCSTFESAASLVEVHAIQLSQVPAVGLDRRYETQDRPPRRGRP